MLREKLVKIEHGLLRLAAQFDESMLVRKSSTIIDAFDLVKARSDAATNVIERAETIRTKILKKGIWNSMRKFVSMQHRKRRNELTVIDANKLRLQRH